MGVGKVAYLLQWALRSTQLARRVYGIFLQALFWHLKICLALALFPVDNGMFCQHFQIGFILFHSLRELQTRVKVGGWNWTCSNFRGLRQQILIGPCKERRLTQCRRMSSLQNVPTLQFEGLLLWGIDVTYAPWKRRRFSGFFGICLLERLLWMSNRISLFNRRIQDVSRTSEIRGGEF